MALWQLLNLGTGCTVTHCWIALWSHESAQTASSERSKYANSEHNIQLCIQCALPVVTIMALWQLLNYIYIYIYRQVKMLSSQQRISPEGSQTDSQPKLEGQIYTQLSRNKH